MADLVGRDERIHGQSPQPLAQAGAEERLTEGAEIGDAYRGTVQITARVQMREAFIGVGSGCNAPQALVDENVFTPGQEDAEYCTSYSWPTGGVIVPTYDVQASVDHSTGQGNITIDWTQFPTDADLQSWHVN